MLHSSSENTHLGISSEEAIRDWNVDVKRQRLQDAGLHGDELLLLVRIITDIKEIVNTGRGALLQCRKNINQFEKSLDKNVT